MKSLISLSILLVFAFMLFSCQSQEEKSKQELANIYAIRKTDQGRYMAELEAFIHKTPKELPTYKQAVTLFVDGFKDLAKGWMNNGRYDQALEFIEKALKYDETNQELLKMKEICGNYGDVTEEDIKRVSRGMTDQDVIHILGNPYGGIEKKLDENQVPYYIMKYMIEMNPNKMVFISLNENKAVALIRYHVDRKFQDEYPERKESPIVPKREADSPE